MDDHCCANNPGSDMNRCQYTASVAKNFRLARHQCRRSSAVNMSLPMVVVLISIIYVLAVFPVQRVVAFPQFPTETIAEEEIVSDTASIRECSKITPCGWAVYVPFTRRIDYFMKNTCYCPPDKSCLKTDDDLSVNAYIYRCSVRPNGTTTEDPDLSIE